MRIGAVLKPDVAATLYRAGDPVTELGNRGHDVRILQLADDCRVDLRQLRGCDVVHIYRRGEDTVVAAVDRLRRNGVAITWDNDDDPRLLPKESPTYRQHGGRRAHLDFESQVKMLDRAHVVTTTNPVLAARYRDAGATQVIEIENYLASHQFASGRRRHEGFVIGWVAGLEHIADAKGLRIAEALRCVMDRHPEVRVVTIGLRLDLDPARYTHHEMVSFHRLPEHIRRFDVAIAPLADIPMSYARSNVKVKEYAAAGVPWLASARGPYDGLGPEQGGWLVDDGDWPAAIDRLVTSRMTRLRLRRRARAWAKTQRLSRHLDEWLAAFELAADTAARDRSEYAVR